jgi:acetolactate synthase I/II/III large subunit
MKVYEALARVVVAEDCGPLFSLLGDANYMMLAALGDSGPRVIAGRNEAAVIAMADGHARATGRTALATITCGPGLTQAGTSLVAAARNASPLVVLTGDTPPHWPIKLQLLDQRRFVEACEARYHAVAGLDTLAADLAEAFLAARLLRRPVVVSLDLDLLERDLPDGWTYAPSAGFHAGTPVMRPDAAAVDDLGRALAAARRPVLVAGRGAALAGARGEIAALAVRTGALLGTTLLARGLFEGDPYDAGVIGGYASSATRRLVGEADLVVGFGAELGSFTTQGMAPGVPVVRVDLAPLPWSSGLPPGRLVQGDARETARMLLDRLALTDGGAPSTGFRTEATRAALAAPVALPPRPNDGADPRRLMHGLSQALDRPTVVTVGVGHFASFPAIYLDLPPGGAMRFCLQFGSVGQTLPVALGAALAEPEKLHICIEGDASLMMNLQEFETVARHAIPLVVLVYNDGGLGAEVHKLTGKGIDPAVARFAVTDFVAIARAVGGDGVVVEHEDAITDAMATAHRATGLFVIDARVSPTTASDPYRRSHMGLPAESPLVQGRLINRT